MKVCSKCGEDKPLEDFGEKPPAPDGRRRWYARCKRCDADYMAQYRTTNPVVNARAAARSAAIRRVIALNPLLYQVIHEEELQKRGLS